MLESQIKRYNTEKGLNLLHLRPRITLHWSDAQSNDGIPRLVVRQFFLLHFCFICRRLSLGLRYVN